MKIKFNPYDFKDGLSCVSNCVSKPHQGRPVLESILITASNLGTKPTGECNIRFESCDGYTAARYYCTAEYERSGDLDFTYEAKFLLKSDGIKVTAKGGPVVLEEYDKGDVPMLSVTQGEKSWHQMAGNYVEYLNLDKVIQMDAHPALDISFDPEMMMKVMKACIQSGETCVHFTFTDAIHGVCIDGDCTRAYVLPKRSRESAKELYSDRH